MKKITRILCALIAVVLTFSCAAFAAAPTEDRSGNPIVLPAEINRIISLAPATTQILESLGVLDKLVAIDTQTPAYVQGVDHLPQFDMMTPDVEQIAALQPDIIYTSGMSYIEGNPFQALTDMGVCVVDIPSSASIADVKLDIVFTAACLGMEAEGQALADEMQQAIDELSAIGATITDKKTVMFEISALPYIYSFGSGTFLDEMITLLGAENVFADQVGWLAITEESAVAADPDVILTSVNYIEDSVGEILSRTGWQNVAAVANKDVYYIDNGASSLPNHHIVDAMIEMALAIYPEAYASFAE
ncbi:MAG: ABC transporter substrate-binding protein [Clostridiales bacterium]|nr:ABC transporter substrate-binding protein [Clostridiales bacterium]